MHAAAKRASIDLARDREPAQGVACLTSHSVTDGDPTGCADRMKADYCEPLLPFMVLMRSEEKSTNYVTVLLCALGQPP